MLDWLTEHGELLAWLGIGSAAVFIISLLSLPWLVSLIPDDYFSQQHRQATPWQQHHPAIRALLLIAKNLLGLVLLVGGIIMLVTPGQGILTIAMGLLMLDYPGKYQLERKIASTPSIKRSLNWLRSKRGKPPLITD